MFYFYAIVKTLCTFKSCIVHCLQCPVLIVFRLRGVVLMLYLCVAASTGVLCGYLGYLIVKRVAPVLRFNLEKEKIK